MALRDEIKEILKKYGVENLRIEVTDTHGKMFTSNWTTEVKATLIGDLEQAFLTTVERAEPIEGSIQEDSDWSTSTREKVDEYHHNLLNEISDSGSTDD